MATEHLTYRQTSYDAGRVIPRPGQPVKATFFDAQAYLDGSTPVGVLEEKVIVRWLMLNPVSRRLLLEVLRLPEHATHRCEVVQPFYTPGQRDIDLILCPGLSPQLAFALECKRVRVRSVNPELDQLNRLADVAGGVQQANELYNGRNAFFQTYLCIITEVENEIQDDRNIPNRGIRSHSKPQRGDTSRTTFRQIVEFPGREKLHADIGIIHIEVDQPSRLSIEVRANIRAHVYRRAISREQPAWVTRCVREIM
jgi:hypothetical protein